MNFMRFPSDFQFIFASNFKSDKSHFPLLATMAIPFLSEEYSQRDTNSANNNSYYQQAQQRATLPHNSHPVNLDSNNNRNQSVSNNSEEEDLGFLSQLIRELVAVYNDYSNRRTANNSQNGSSGIASSVNGAGGSERNPRRISDQQPLLNQDNQGPAVNLTATNPTSTISTTGLPDIIACHFSTSLRINSSRPISPPAHDDLLNEPADELQQQEPELILRGHPEESDYYSSSSEDDDGQFSMDFKMEISYSYRRIGRDLRNIADNYEHQNAARAQQRRLRRGGSSSTTATFKLDFAFKVALPVTLVGLGLAALFRGRS